MAVLDIASASVADQEARLVDLIYGSLLDERHWTDFVGCVRDCHPNGHATLFFHDDRRGAGALALNAGFDQSWVEQYSAVYAAKNPWMARAAQRPVGVGARSEQTLSRAELMRTEFYADFLRPQEITTGVGLTILREEGCTFALSVVGSDMDEADSQRLAGTFGRISPHLRRVFDLHRREGGDPLRAAQPLIDSLEAGVLIVGPGRKLIRSSRLGAALLEAGRGMRLDIRQLVVIDSDAAMEAVEAMTALDWSLRGLPRSVSHVVQDRDGIPLKITLVAAGRTAIETYFAGPRVFVLVEALDRPLKLSVAMLRALYDLTPAEARIMLSIADGGTLGAVASRQGVSRETVRTHFRSICEKLGVKRQSEAVHLVCRAGYGVVAPEVFG